MTKRECIHELFILRDAETNVANVRKKALNALFEYINDPDIEREWTASCEWAFGGEDYDDEDF